ncbi:TonB-dependent receptor plug domain-containing protein [Hymenobacter sp. NST-14]|uniref:TonB-dependent receptor plug domain-containing protein n=1 Tax=Hymenobacter piscis TaxID=2839984 RepID=UPI001C01D249|nr:TonB-dependent receptor plug domain-containing protein [Hymenobacter piscis]MBT9392514.1 TonB-dependent receptor plug domain-containing protein [Hymenobacter piscis]
MIRFLSLPLLLLGFAASAQTASTTDNPRVGLNKPTASVTPGLNRGTATPLYVIDGRATDALQLAEFKPEQIEGIVMLKSQQAVALYGESAQGGAVLITTKPTTSR